MTDESQEPALTDAELRSFGILPGNTMGSERIKDQPIRVRYKDDLITRDGNGALGHWLGYYSAEQIALRKRWGRKVFEEMKATSPIYKLLAGDLDQ